MRRGPLALVALGLVAGGCQAILILDRDVVVVPGEAGASADGGGAEADTASDGAIDGPSVLAIDCDSSNLCDGFEAQTFPSVTWTRLEPASDKSLEFAPVENERHDGARSARCAVPAGLEGIPQFSLLRDTPKDAVRLTASFWIKVAELPADSSIEPLLFYWSSNTIGTRAIAVAIERAGLLVVNENRNGAYSESAALSFTFPGWHQVELRVELDKTPPLATVTLDTPSNRVTKELSTRESFDSLTMYFGVRATARNQATLSSATVYYLDDVRYDFDE